MRRRLEAFERRLAALHAALAAWSRESDEEEQRRERYELLVSMARAGLEQAGIDPDEAASLRPRETSETPRPFTHPLRRLAERERPRTLLDALYEMTQLYHKGRPPDLRSASVMQLIGYYCFGDGAEGTAAREAPA